MKDVSILVLIGTLGLAIWNANALIITVDRMMTRWHMEVEAPAGPDGFPEASIKAPIKKMMIADPMD